MTHDQALQLVGLLVCNTNGWDEPSAATWTNQLAALPDHNAAQRAIQTLINSWTSTMRPTWGRLMEHYQATPRNNERQLGNYRGPEMSFAEYLARLKANADSGDRDATNDYANWQRHLKTSNTFAAHAARQRDTTPF